MSAFACLKYSSCTYCKVYADKAALIANSSFELVVRMLHGFSGILHMAVGKSSYAFCAFWHVLCNDESSCRLVRTDDEV